MLEAILYQKKEQNNVVCHVCEHHCHVKEGNRGRCGVRENIKGTMYAINYPRCVASSIDRVEKKPLRGFLPNTMTYSFAAEGCNLNCIWCQNADIAMHPKHHQAIRGSEVSPTQHVQNAIDHDCPSISYTYSEPTIFIEYALETMKLARKAGLKNIWVSNGYMTKEALELIMPYLDAINVDYKAPNDALYKQYTQGKASVVLRNMAILKKQAIHLEVTCLLVPEIFQQQSNLKDLLQTLYDTLGEQQIIHLSRFFGAYKMHDQSPTSKAMMLKAQELALEIGFNTIYLGNI